MAHEARMEEWFTPRRQNTGASKPAETNTLSTLRSKPWTAGTEAERNGRSMHKSIEPSEEFSLDIAFHGRSSTCHPGNVTEIGSHRRKNGQNCDTVTLYRDEGFGSQNITSPASTRFGLFH
jgi:hypothetical protein